MNIKSKILIIIGILSSILLVACNREEVITYKPINNTEFQEMIFQESLKLDERLQVIEKEYQLENTLNMSEKEREKIYNNLEKNIEKLKKEYKKDEYNVNKETRMVYKQLELIDYNLMNLLNLSNKNEMTDENIQKYNELYEVIMSTFERIEKPLQFMYIQKYYPEISIESVVDIDTPKFDSFLTFLLNSNGLLHLESKSNNFMFYLNKLIDDDYNSKEEKLNDIFLLETYVESMQEISDLYVSNNYFQTYVDSISEDNNETILSYKDKVMSSDNLQDKTELITYQNYLNEKFFANGEKDIFIYLFSEKNNE